MKFVSVVLVGAVLAAMALSPQPTNAKFAQKLAQHIKSLKEVGNDPFQALLEFTGHGPVDSAVQKSQVSSVNVEAGRNLQPQPIPTCPFPLIFVTDQTVTNFIDAGNPLISCAFECEGTMVTKDELRKYNIVEMVVSGISVFLALFLVATWGLFSVKGKQKMTFWISVCSLMVALAIFVAALAEGSPRNVWCKDDVEGFRQEDGLSWCVLQGILLIFFGLALCAWWFCSCFDLFSKLYLRKRNIQHYLKYYHIFSWGMPGLNVLILLSTKSFGFEQPRLWCFLDAQSPNEFEFVFFYGWVGLLWFIGMIMFLLVLWSVLSQTRSYRRGESSGSYFRKLALYRTPIVFVLAFSVFWIVFFSFRLITVIDEDQYIKSAKTWFNCLLVSFFVFRNPSPFNTETNLSLTLDPFDPDLVGCGETQPGRVPPGLLSVAVATISGNSILLFMVFGLQKENFKLWFNYIKSLIDGYRGKGAANEGVRNDDVSISDIKKNGAVGGSKSSLTDQVAVRANEAISTFKEIRRDITFGVVNAYKIVTCQEREHYAQPNRSPRLKFDQPSYNQTTYTPRYYINSQTGSQRAISPSLGNGAGMNMGTALTAVPVGNPMPPNMGGSYEAGYTGYPDQGQGYQQQQQPNYHHSGWSDAYDDPLWGINVEF